MRAPVPTPARQHRRRLLVLGLLVVVPFFLRLWPIQHGFPTTAHVPDTHIVKNALGMLADKHPVPPVGKYSTYPNLLPYVLAPVYAGQYALGRVTGAWGGGEEFKQTLYREPARVHLPARILVALLGALTPLVVLGAGRAMGLGVGAWVAAWLVGTGLLHVQFSTQERPWAPMVLFLALAAWPAARYVTSGRARDLFLSGLAAALSFSCHQSGLAALGITGLAWALGPPGWTGAALKERLRRGFVCVGLFALLSLAVGHPYYVVHGLVDKGQVAAGDALKEGIYVGGQAFVFQLRAETFRKLGTAFVGYDPVTLLFGVLGLVFALRRRAALPATLFALGWAALFLSNQGDHTRYLLPLVVLLAWPAGMFAEALWSSKPARAALLVLLAVPLVQAVRFGWVLRQDDTRALAAAKLTEEHAGDAVAVDMWGPELPLNAKALERLSQHRSLGGREAHRLEIYVLYEAEPPGPPGLDALPVEAIFDYALRFRSSWVEDEEQEVLGEDPTDALLRLGMTHVLVVDRAPGDGQPPLLLDPATTATNEQGGAEPKMAPLRLDGGPLWTIQPGPEATDAALPTELSFPLTQLWQVDRPGPALTLYRLAADEGR